MCNKRENLIEKYRIVEIVKARCLPTFVVLLRDNNISFFILLLRLDDIPVITGPVLEEPNEIVVPDLAGRLVQLALVVVGHSVSATHWQEHFVALGTPLFIK